MLCADDRFTRVSTLGMICILGPALCISAHFPATFQPPFRHLSGEYFGLIFCRTFWCRRQAVQREGNTAINTAAISTAAISRARAPACRCVLIYVELKHDEFAFTKDEFCNENDEIFSTGTGSWRGGAILHLKSRFFNKNCGFFY